MRKSVFNCLFFCLQFLALTFPASAHQDPLAQLLIRKGIITEEEIAQMENELAQTPQPQETPHVDMAKSTSKLRIKGRAALGYFDSGKSGSYPSSSFEAPEAKVQLEFGPDSKSAFVMRANLNNATFNNVDYLYVESKCVDKETLKLTSRLGRFKLDFGEETWANNPVEEATISASATNVSGNDEGIQLGLGIGDKKYPLKVTGAITNGVSGVGSDTTTPKAFTGKISYRFCSPFYASASYYHSGQLKASNSEATISGLVTRPASSFKWDRQIWELDARYDFRPGKVIDPPAYTDSLVYLKLAYGRFYDDAKPVADRDGGYGFVEGLWNITDKIYTVHRSSFIKLDADQTAVLNSITANQYNRYTFGLGYRFTEATQFKTEYSINQTRKTNTGKDPHDNQFAAIVSAVF